MSQTERIYWIDDQIRRGRYPNAESVCEHFGVSRRTAYLDRDYLKERLHAPVVFDRTRNGWTYSDAAYVLPYLAFSDKEAGALRRSLLAAQEYLPPADIAPLQLIAERLTPGSAGPTLNDREIILGAIRLAASATVPDALLADCRRAAGDRYRLRIVYYGAHRDEMTTRIVQPYHLLNWRGEHYLIGWCELRQDFRQFFLGRIREWEVLEPPAAYRRDATFDVGTYLARGFGLKHGEQPVRVRVWFSPYQARWIRERQYHETQESEERDDGSVVLTFRVAGVDEVRRWVLSFGAEAEVLEPELLRNQIAAEIENLRKTYKR
jgi:predicted DNA-binding transcriptional regulator YafY